MTAKDFGGISEVDDFSDLPKADDPDLELGDVYRVRARYVDGGLISPGIILKWNGRAWVPVNGFKAATDESDGKKDDVAPVGAANDRGAGERDMATDDGINGHRVVYPYDAHPGAGECYNCGAHEFDEPCLGPFMSGSGSGGDGSGDDVIRVAPGMVFRRHDIQARDADADVLGRWLPTEFVKWYVALIDMITGPGGGMGNGGAVDDVVIPGLGAAYGGLGQVKSGSSESLKLSKGSKALNSSALMRSEWASMLRDSVDRKLRKIARDLKTKLDEEVKRASTGKARSGVRRCSGKCRKFGEADWLYCARCGGPMEEVSG